jgi:hypothetical protein
MKTLTVGRAVLVAALIVTSAGWLGRVTAQQPPATRDVLPELLAEVRGLRAAMEQLASAGPRTQLFASRLQLQETRINNMLRRLDTVRDRVAESQREMEKLQTEQRQLEKALAGHKASSAPGDPEEANMATVVLDTIKARAAAARSTLDRYTAEEMQLTADLTTEQGRWIEINRRLDELEQALIKK